ncbi:MULTISPECIES: LacI family DNA-binding transcriptional regulator [Providencia]|uniref:LacI family transcriptional regulator n=1 Tax=Providencia heimbachae ATCC 35613 TaxID=1354272 RepID=A0A1B7K291_9GAMM|nr:MULTISPECIES: LacI family DNA-binding transcriptional regulator [Providencia]MBP6121859.1 LacI family DNA-binding transcriptional regulator [Providencia sp.]MDD9340625.1 LacI family DNA-binding transcriptional regulator [Providencia heimbachae]NIH23068.1 LacI family transcriptional regulator [Providencia heimbachae]OAT54273.1 LacI family transcriptional regulator [Providencia heimbachae ATCC 35613]SQH13663.1 Gluconate utilization system GNT-I transcriptional repressor [Providencia heimbacha
MQKIRKRKNTGRVTLQDVAKHAGVGSMTVSRALRTPELVSDKLREKINSAVEELGYIPNSAAGILASGQSRTVAVLVPSLRDNASSVFLQSLQEVLNKNSYQVVIGSHDYQQKKESEVLFTLLQSNPAALVIFGAINSENVFTYLKNIDIPVINVAGESIHPFTLSIKSNIGEAVNFLTRYLLEKGHKKIGYIGAQMDSKIQSQQLSGWNKAMLSHNQSADQSITTPYVATMDFGRQAISEMLTRQPDLEAVICSHEMIALGVMFECQRRLIQVPRMLSVACVEGSSNCDHIHPSLTSVRIDYSKIARETAKKIQKWLADADYDYEAVHEEIIFPYKFEARQSA